MNDTPIPTPRTDEFVTTWDFYNDPFEAIDHAQTLERELTAAQEKIEMLNIRYGAAAMHHDNNMGEVMDQRDDFKKELEIANYRLKGERHPDDNGIMADGEIDVKALNEQLAQYAGTNVSLNIDLHLAKQDIIELTEQRDRLATERDWIYEKWEGMYNTVNATNRCVCGSELHHAVMDELLLFAKYRSKYLSEPTEQPNHERILQTL